jgi:hypothetical protein
MQYDDGQQVKLGDRVALEDGRRHGVVIWLADEPESAPDWSYLASGAVVIFDEVGHVHERAL